MKPLSGVVDMDGTYVHPAPRKANKKADRIDYRLQEKYLAMPIVLLLVK